MKILFIASISNPSASGRQRLWALEKNDIDITVINKDIYNKGKWIYRIAKLFKFSSLLINKRLENEILNCCKKVVPDLVWYEWPREISTDLFKKLKKMGLKPFLISFQDDNPWGKRKKDLWMWQNYLKSIPFFDIHMVKRESDIENLTLLGGKKCYLWQHGMYSPLFNPDKTKSSLKYPVSFVGTCMDNRDNIIEFLLENNVDIHIFGNKWKDRTNLVKRFPKNFHPAAEGESYAQVIKESKICLGLVSHSNIDEWTMRSYEVPACGTLLIAENTETHKWMFDGLSENILFKNNEECLSLINRFLEQPYKLESVAKEINELFKIKNWTLEHRMATFLKKIDNFKKENE